MVGDGSEDLQYIREVTDIIRGVAHRAVERSEQGRNSAHPPPIMDRVGHAGPHGPTQETSCIDRLLEEGHIEDAVQGEVPGNMEEVLCEAVGDDLQADRNPVFMGTTGAGEVWLTPPHSPVEQYESPERVGLGGDGQTVDTTNEGGHPLVDHGYALQLPRMDTEGAQLDPEEYCIPSMEVIGRTRLGP